MGDEARLVVEPLGLPGVPEVVEVDPIPRLATQEVRDEVGDLATYIRVTGVAVTGALVADSPAGVDPQ